MRQPFVAGFAIAASLAVISPALAHNMDGPPPPEGMERPADWGHESWRGGNEGAWTQQREAWLAECRRRIGSRGGTTGAVLGGVVGGIAGHEIAGRHDKTLGTVAGAAVGAVAGAAIERSARRHDNDQCEAMLESQAGYYPQQGNGYPAYGYAYGYAPVMMMVPMQMVAVPAAPKRDCKETVTTEYVTTYETVYRKVRQVRYAPAPAEKRVRIVPDKRVRMAPDKRVTAD